MRKRYVPDSRWLINIVMLAGLVALLFLSVASLPRLRSVPHSITVADQSTPRPTQAAQVVAAYTASALSTATAVPSVPGVPVVAVVVSDTATPAPVTEAVAVVPAETAQPDGLLPDPEPEPAPDLEAQPAEPTLAPVATLAISALPTVAPERPVQKPAPARAAPTIASQPSAQKPAPTRVIVRPVPTKTPDPNLLPNGVRYGDHKPNLPERIVRVASPNIKLDASVYEVYVKSNKWEVAEYAAGHHYNSLNPGEGGNVVLNGHNNWKGEVFRYLENTKVGDLIQVWTLEGKEYDYRVTEIRKLKEAGVSMAQRLKNASVMDPTNHEQLTLITCWPYTTFTHRIIIIATPVK